MALGHDDAAASVIPGRRAISAFTRVSRRREAKAASLWRSGVDALWRDPESRAAISARAALDSGFAGLRPRPGMTALDSGPASCRERRDSMANRVLTAMAAFKPQLKHDLHVRGVTVAEISAPREHHDAAEATSVDPWAW